MLKTIDAVPTRDELVYARLRRAIVEGTLEPGQDVVVTTVAAQLGVSRIPVMHGCQRLVGDGFLVSNPRRSVTVAPIAEGNEVLLALECVALEHAGQRATAADLDDWDELNRAVRAFRRSPGSSEMYVADYRFHTTRWAAAGKPYLYQQLSLVFDHTESPASWPACCTIQRRPPTNTRKSSTRSAATTKAAAQAALRGAPQPRHPARHRGAPAEAKPIPGPTAAQHAR